MKKHMIPFVAAAAAVLSLTAAPAVDAAALPENNVPGDAMMVISFDVKAVPEADMKAAVDTIAAIGMDDGDDPAEFLQQYADWREQFTAAGGEAVVMVVTAPEPGEAAGDGAPAQPGKPKMYMFTKVTADATPDGIKAAMQALEDDEDAGDEAGEEAAEMKVTKAEPGWFAVSDDEMQALPAGDGDPEAAATFSRALASAGDAPITAGIVLNDKARASLDQAQQNPGVMMVLGGVIPPLKQLEFGTLAVTLGEAPTMAAKMQFPEAAQAQQFVAGWTTTLQFFQNMATLDQGGGAKMDMQTAQDLFGMLKMDQQDNTASLKLDKSFLEVVSKIKEQQAAGAGEGM